MITPDQVIQYTEFQEVKNRSPEKLKFDILEAEQVVFSYVGHDFKEYDEIPKQVELALIKLTEYFAINNSQSATIKGIQSESLGDYSYSLSDGSTFNTFSIGKLLDAYVEKTGQKGVKFRLRSL